MSDTLKKPIISGALELLVSAEALTMGAPYGKLIESVRGQCVNAGSDATIKPSAARSPRTLPEHSVADFPTGQGRKAFLSHRIEVIAALGLGAFLVFLVFGLRGSFWISDDYALLSMAHAIHLEWRLSHGHIYPAPALAGHPGIPFYFASWLAVALAIPSSSAAGFDRFLDIVANAERIQAVEQMIAITVSVLSAYAFCRIARRVVSTRVALVALGLWLGSTYQVLLTAASLSIETFALPLNVLFLWMLVRLANAGLVPATNCLLAGIVAAIGYLLKLPYLYVAAGLGAAILADALVHRRGIHNSVTNVIVMVESFLVFGAGIAYLVLGREALDALLQFHYDIIFHSGHYGQGAPGIFESAQAKAMLDSFFNYGSFAPWATLLLGFLCVALSLGCWLSKKCNPPEVVIGIGAGVAALFAGLGVLKHFNEHYAAGAAPTLAVAVVALSLLIRGIRPKTATLLRGGCAFLVIVGLPYSMRLAADSRAGHAAYNREVLNDRRDLEEILKLRGGNAVFTYRVPMREFGEGFVVHYSGIPDLKQEYIARRQTRVSSYVRRNGSFRFAVLDKVYFRDASAIRKASNLDLAGTVTILPSKDDELFELRHCFVVWREAGFSLPAP